MKINWKVRFKNPVFLKSIILSAAAPVVTYLGINLEDITTWNTAFEMILRAISNPVVFVSVLVSVFNAVNDPTTSGYSDSFQALSYKTPKGREKR